MRRFLLVDDNALLRRAIRRVLQKNHVLDDAAATHVLDEAATMAQAHELLEANVYERAIFDVRLPDGDGIALLKWVRKSGRRFPVLVLTASNDYSLAGEVFLLGDSRVIYKPLKKECLLEFLQVTPRPSALEVVVCEWRVETGLSPQRGDLVLAMARGTRRRDLAAVLRLSENTIKTMIKEILKATRMASMEAVVAALLARAAEPAGDGRASSTRLRSVGDDTVEEPEEEALTSSEGKKGPRG